MEIKIENIFEKKIETICDNCSYYHWDDGCTCPQNKPPRNQRSILDEIRRISDQGYPYEAILEQVTETLTTKIYKEIEKSLHMEYKQKSKIKALMKIIVSVFESHLVDLCHDLDWVSMKSYINQLEDIVHDYGPPSLYGSKNRHGSCERFSPGSWL